jgi:hypothetical protein
MTCRDEVLVAAQELSRRSSNGEFALREVLKFLEQKGTQYKESTIRTHVTSRMCANSPNNHGVTYSDLERTNHSTYRLKSDRANNRSMKNPVLGDDIPRPADKLAKKNHDLEALSEDEIKEVLSKWLKKDGWKTKVAWGRTPGIDIEAIKPGSRWIIEAKGTGSRPQMRVNYFLGILGETLQRMDDAGARYSIALPDLPQYRRLWERLPDLAIARTSISIIFVSQDGTVDLIG